jgi:CheY-like chemotaxis protein
MLGKSTTVLVVDDDPEVLDATCAIVEELGYAALSARAGEEALAIIRRDKSLGVLLTDIMMPDMDGWHLARCAKEIRPDLSVIYTTGYSRAPVPDDGAPGFGPLLPKPWRRTQLDALLRKVVTPR